jgi:hypothetical protein
MKSGSFNLLVPSGTVQACTGITELLFYLLQLVSVHSICVPFQSFHVYGSLISSNMRIIFHKYRPKRALNFWLLQFSTFPCHSKQSLIRLRYWLIPQLGRFEALAYVTVKITALCDCRDYRLMWLQRLPPYVTVKITALCDCKDYRLMWLWRLPPYYLRCTTSMKFEDNVPLKCHQILTREQGITPQKTAVVKY